MLSFIEAAALRTMLLRYYMHELRQLYAVLPITYNNYLLSAPFILFVLLISYFSVSLEMPFFPSIFAPIIVVFSFHGDYVVPGLFFFRMVFCYLVTKGWIFDISLRENPTNHS